MPKHKIGLIGTCYNTGISHIAAGFAEHLGMKALLVDYKPFAKFPERFPNHRLTKQITPADIDWLLDGIDVLFTIETPYDWTVYEKAHRRGIKTVLMPMIEWLERSRPELKQVDLFVCPSSSTTRIMRDAGFRNVVEVPCEVPVDTEKFRHIRARRGTVTKARTFLHNAGHGGLMGRNSTHELLEAILLTRETCPEAKFIIRSQYPVPVKAQDDRITYLEGNVKDYRDLYTEGDVWIMPWKYGVAVLGLQESMAAGMLPMITDMQPFSEFMPASLLIEPARREARAIYAGQKELWSEQSPALIARAIKRLYDMPDLSRELDWARITADFCSWDTWKDRYITMFNSL